MKKRILSIFIAMSMATTFIPIIGHAENVEPEEVINDIPVVESETEVANGFYSDYYSYEEKVAEDEMLNSRRFIVKYKNKDNDDRKELKSLAKEVFVQLKEEKDNMRQEWKQELEEGELDKVVSEPKRQKLKSFFSPNVETNEIIDDKPEYEVIELKESVNEERFVSMLDKEMGDAVEYIQPDVEMELSSFDTSEIIAAVTDKNENLAQAHNVSTGEGVTVALIDTGVDITHPELTDNIAEGWDFFNDTELTYSEETSAETMHGTHVAGIISQVAPDVKVMPLKVFEKGKAYTSDIIKAIEYAKENGADIVNCSWGNSAENPALKEVMENSDIFFVAAVGNSRINLDETPIYPASYGLDNLINVASINQDGGMSYFSNYGESVDIAAWGRDVYSTMPNGEYGNMNGTSMSAGYVTGAAALAVATGTDISELKNTLKSSADKASTLDGKVEDKNVVDFANVVYGVTPQDTTYINAEDDFDRWAEKTPEENWLLFGSSKNIQVDAGLSHTIVLKEDGTVWTWGYGFNGQLGYMESEWYINSPHQVPGLKDICKIVANDNYSFALTEDGDVYAWGDNTGHYLIDINMLHWFSPTKINNLNNVKTIDVAGRHIVALKEDGTVWTWGSNSYGELGDGTSVNSTEPKIINGLTDIKTITAGYGYTMALKEDGTVWTWGYNKYGQLGDGTATSKNTPTMITNMANVKDINAGYSHSFALKENGTVYAWGSDYLGQLGDGTFSNKHTPILISGLSDIKKIEAGTDYTTVLKNDGTVWTCGYNINGQLGNEIDKYSGTFKKVNELQDVIDIAAGANHVIVLKSDGTIWTWGNNQKFQLGFGVKIIRSTPAPVDDLTDVVAISAGMEDTIALKSDGSICTWGKRVGKSGPHDTTKMIQTVEGFTNIKAISRGYYNIMALKSDGTVWISGNNEYGQLGNGTEVTSSTNPVQVSNLTDITSISVKRYHAVALKSDGTVYTWGNNECGQLGDGSEISRNTPGLVNGLTNVKAVSAGNNYTVALTEDGIVYVWGDNSSGQLGDGTKIQSNIPKAVDNLTDVVSIYAGHDYILALKSDGTVYGWGDNFGSKLGYGKSIYYTPNKIPRLSNITAIAAGGYATIALKSDGTVYAGGVNNRSQLGESDSNHVFYAKKIDGLSDIIAISEGDEHTVALKSDGTVYTLGHNIAGQLGADIIYYSSVPKPVDGNINVSYNNNIESISSIETVNVAKGTENLNLPKRVDAILDDSSKASVPVNWDNTSYIKDQLGEQTITGTLVLPEGLTNTKNISAELKVIVHSQIQSIQDKYQVADRGLPLGVGAKTHTIGDVATTVDVPEKVTVLLDDNSTIELNVTWDDSSYNPYQTGTQTITGTVELVDGLSNPDDVSPQLQITVVPAEYVVLTTSPENISVNVLGGTSLAKVYEQITPKKVDIEAMNTETGEVVYIYSDYTFSNEYEENQNYNPNQLGTQTLKGRFNNAIVDTDFVPPYVNIQVNVTASEIANVPSVEMNAYQSFEFNSNTNIPQQVTVETENGLTAQVGVEWNTNNYQKDVAGDQIITGTLVNLPVGVLQPETEKTATLIVHVQLVTYKITSLVTDENADPNDMAEIDAGYTLEELYNHLPSKTVKVELESTSLDEPITTEYNMPFTFEEENNTDYDSNVADLYVLTGTFVLPTNITNPDNLDYQIFVQTMPLAIQSVEPVYLTTIVGTSFANIEKPSQVSVTLENGETKQIDVNWGAGTGYVSDSDDLTEDNPIQSTIYGELSNLPEYINYDDEQATLVITVILPRIYYINSISPVRIPDTGTKKVNLGSSLEDIYNGLDTHSVTVQLRNMKNVISTQQVTFTLREADNPNYNSMSEEEFELTAYLNLPENVENPDNKQLKISVTPTKYRVKSATAVRITGVEAGTQFEDIGLPDNAPVVYTDNSTGALPATWNSSTYSPNKIGAQVVRGTFNLPLPVYAENPNNRQPVAAVTVVNSNVTIVSAEPLENTVKKSIRRIGALVTNSNETEDENIPGLIMRKYRVELLHEDGSITTEVISVFEEVQEN